MHISLKRPFLSAFFTAALILPLESTRAGLDPDDVDANVFANERPNAVDQLIVKYKDMDGRSGELALNRLADRIKSLPNGDRVPSIRKLGTGAYVARIRGAQGTRSSKLQEQMSQLMRELQSDPRVDYVEVDRMLHPLLFPNDPRFAEQWHYYEPLGGLNLPDAWDKTNGSGVITAVIDTGITVHPDLEQNILPGYDMISSTEIANDGNGRDSDPSDPGDAVSIGECGVNFPPIDQQSSWHGTHVAGTVAAVGNNNLGVSGVAYGGKLIPIRALGKCGGRTSDIADSIIWAAGGSVPGVPQNLNPAKVINLSLGGSGACDNTSQAAINRAVQLGATVVVAAGNSAINAANATPANCQNVIAVAATNRSGGRANYSNFGDVVDVAAPGGQQIDGISEGVLSTLNTGRVSPNSPDYRFYQGTSMAAPHVAGTAALLYSLDSTLTPAEVEQILKSSARSFPRSCAGCGAGIVDAAAAVKVLTDDTGQASTKLENGTPIAGLSGALNSESLFFIEVPEGARNLRIAILGGTGDADIYVRYAAQPTLTTYDCRPYASGNSEVCDFSNVSRAFTMSC